ncbi:MAG: helix-turn-helix domain-containing protein [Oscillospiraceae bacterium]|nr:helix-turn-helix domain-containing protein [Oscillospiraceae bacterium]
MERKSIGSFIAALRRAHGLTQQELADRLNVSNKSVSRWENDETLPDLTLIPVLAEIFGVTSDEILRGERAPAKDPGEAAPERTEKRTEQQRKRLLNAALMKFSNMCIVSLTIFLCSIPVGYLIAMIAENGWAIVLTGFCGLIAGIVTLEISSGNARMRIDGGGDEAEEMTQAVLRKMYQLKQAVLVVYLMIVTVALSVIVAIGLKLQVDTNGSFISRVLAWWPLWLIGLAPLLAVIMFSWRYPIATGQYAGRPKAQKRDRLICITAIVLTVSLTMGQTIYQVAAQQRRERENIIASSDAYVYETVEDFESFMKQYKESEPYFLYNGEVINESDPVYLNYIEDYHYFEITREEYDQMDPDERVGVFRIIPFRFYNKIVLIDEKNLIVYRLREGYLLPARSSMSGGGMSAGVLLFPLAFLGIRSLLLRKVLN